MPPSSPPPLLDAACLSRFCVATAAEMLTWRFSQLGQRRAWHRRFDATMQASARGQRRCQKSLPPSTAVGCHSRARRGGTAQLAFQLPRRKHVPLRALVRTRTSQGLLLRCHRPRCLTPRTTHPFVVHPRRCRRLRGFSAQPPSPLPSRHTLRRCLPSLPPTARRHCSVHPGLLDTLEHSPRRSRCSCPHSFAVC